MSEKDNDNTDSGLDSEKPVEEAESAIKSADAALSEAEASKEKAEKSIQSAETVKKSIESQGLQPLSASSHPSEMQTKADAAIDESKMAIDLAESARLNAEFAREQAQLARNQSEKARNRAESARNAAERSRREIEREKEKINTTLRTVIQAKRTADEALKEAQEAREIAERADQMKTRGVISLSHEMKTPLTTLVGYGQMLKNEINGPLTEKQKKYAHYICLAAEHMLKMVVSILDIQCMEKGKYPLYPEWVDLKPFVEETIGLMGEIAGQQQVQIKFDVPDTLGSAEFDPTSIREILLNLLSNAIKYSEAGVSIDVAVAKSPDEHWVTFTVTDYGAGISEEELPYLFTPFYQLSAEHAAKKKPGHGLGLIVSNRLAEIHAGTLTVESTLGEGSAFTLQIPTHFSDSRE